MTTAFSPSVLNRMLVFFAAVATLAITDAPAGEFFSDLSTDQKSKVDAMEQVMITKAIPGYPWPQARIYQRSTLTPVELMAVFFDYNNAVQYVPNCIVSRVTREISPVRTEVEYEVKVPILKNEVYTAENWLKRTPDNGLKVVWHVLKATSIESSKGMLEVMPYEGGSILRYTNLIKPSSKAAILLRRVALGQMKDTVQAIVTEALKIQKNDPEELNKKIARLESALASVTE